MPDSDRSFRRRAAGPFEGLRDLGAGQRPESREPRSEKRFDQRFDQWLTTGRQLVDGVAGARPGSRASGRPEPGGRASGLPRPGGLGRWVEDKLDWLLEDEDGWREPWEGPALGSRGRPVEPAWGQPGQAPGWPQAAAVPAEFQDNLWASGSGEAAIDPSPGGDPWPPPSSRTTARQAATTQPSSPAPGPTRWPEGPAARPQVREGRRQDFAPVGPAAAASQAPQPQRRRPLEALSRRATPLLPPRSPGPVQSEPAQDWSQDWPDDASFTVARWQRPAGTDPQAPLPLQASLRPNGSGPEQASDPVAQADQPWLQRPIAASPEGPPLASPPAVGPGRPVPRSTRRR